MESCIPCHRSASLRLLSSPACRCFFCFPHNSGVFCISIILIFVIVVCVYMCFLPVSFLISPCLVGFEMAVKIVKAVTEESQAQQAAAVAPVGSAALPLVCDATLSASYASQSSSLSPAALPPSFVPSLNPAVAAAPVAASAVFCTPSSVSSSSAVTSRTAAIAQVWEEVRAEVTMLRLVRHGNIVQYYGCWGPDSTNGLWILMEYCDCGSIGQVLELTNSQLTEPQLAVILGSTLRALLYLHSKHIVFSRNQKRPP